ncbi:MAG: hypothetical protein A2W85_07685 [Bacteroidetes bacterium GWF2_41_31]|nr:MAG: hypothetical protein A2W85_07685 [Bacteroidetes bacterium GWF2_41_31]OFZ10107.1 MAG: hypothetical protein A2338_08190 [Bacteroidetes bacterium RIFOXYB12_FULL_41_6]
MSLSDFIYKHFPVSWFKALRKAYYKLNELLYPPLTENQFSAFLESRLGVKKGMILYVHSSIDKLNIAFSAYRLLELLMESVGEDGTVMFPCWNYRDRAEDYLKQPGALFIVKRSPTTMGLLPELARRHKNAVRSLHPTTSIVAIGAKAHELIDEHHLDMYPNGKRSPLYKMMKYNSRIIGLGEKVVSLSFVHVVEDLMKEDFPLQTLSGKPMEGRVIDQNNQELIIETLVPHLNIGHRDIPGFFNKYISKEACRSTSFQGVNYFSANPSLLFDELKKLAERGKTIYG